MGFGIGSFGGDLRGARVARGFVRACGARVLRVAGVGVGVGICVCIGLGGCQPAQPDFRLQAFVESGDYISAERVITADLPTDKSDRDYIRQRMKLLIVNLAQQDAAGSERAAGEVFDLLSTAGVNPDRTAQTIAILNPIGTEGGSRIWKGEPFEQAMGFFYTAIQSATEGEWGNARAAANASLFRLKDFGNDRNGNRKSPEQIARELPEGAKGEITSGYAAVDTTFAAGYMMVAISAHAMNRPAEEVRDNANRAAQLNPGLRALADTVIAGRFNTVLVADYGRGPQKVAYGMDNAFARFVPFRGFGGDGRQVVVRVMGPSGAASEGGFNIVQDINAMAMDHTWTNLEDVRVAKSHLGTALVLGGLGTAVISRDQTAQFVGLGVAALGALAKATSVADTRYCELIPQRVYIAAVTVDEPGSMVSVQLAGDAAARVDLTGAGPPRAPQKVQLRYVRLPSLGGGMMSGMAGGRSSAAAAGVLTLPWAGMGSVDVSEPVVPRAGSAEEIVPRVSESVVPRPAEPVVPR